MATLRILRNCIEGGTIARLAQENFLPQPAALWRKLREVLTNLADHELAVGAVQQLCDVPDILRTARVEFEQDEIGRTRDADSDFAQIDAHSAMKNASLPRLVADHQIDGTLSVGCDANDSRQRIVVVASSDPEPNATFVEPFP